MKRRIREKAPDTVEEYLVEMDENVTKHDHVGASTTTAPAQMWTWAQACLAIR